MDDPTTAQYQRVPIREIDHEKLLEDDENGFDDLEIGETQKSRHSSWATCSLSPFVSLLSYFITLDLLWMVILSSSGPTIIRVLVTLATGKLLLLGKYTQNRILSNEIMVYIGDLSYLIYLAHWPVIILYKYYNDIADLTIPDMALCILTTLMVSVLLHHSLEAFFITSSTKISFVFVAVTYGLILLALLTGGMQRLSEYAHPVPTEDTMTATTPPTAIVWPTLAPSIASNSTAMAGQFPTTAKKVEFNRQDAIRWNQVQSKIVYFRNPDGCVRDFEAERWTGFTEEPQLRCVSSGNGTAKVLVIGNSYGYRAFPLLHRLFAGRYSQMRLYTHSSRVLLTRDLKSTRFADKQKIVVQKFQPDITFVIEKDTSKTLMNPIMGNVEDDPITKHVVSVVDFLSNNSDTVVIDRQYIKPSFKDGVAYIIQKRLQLGKSDFEDLRLSKKGYEDEFVNEIARMSTIKNDNVILNRVEEQLCPGKECYFFDRDSMHSYYGDRAAHLTSEGLKMLEPNYSEIIEDFLLRLQSSKTDSS